MAYRVSLASPAETDAYAAFERIRETAPMHAEKWLSRRHLLHGKRKRVYRIIFHIREDEQHVRVLRIWHASRDAITADDVEE